MGSKSPWKIEAVRRLIETDEDLEWFTCNPGPQFRGQLSSWFKPGISGPNTRILLRVIYLPTGQVKEARISKSGRRYTVYYEAAYLTLEAATKKMKEDLRPRHD
jgi:hypothetical protein